MKAFAAALMDYLRSTPATAGAGNLVPAGVDKAAIFQAATVSARAAACGQSCHFSDPHGRAGRLPGDRAAIFQAQTLRAGPLANGTPTPRVRKPKPVATDWWPPPLRHSGLVQRTGHQRSGHGRTVVHPADAGELVRYVAGRAARLRHRGPRPAGRSGSPPPPGPGVPGEGRRPGARHRTRVRARERRPAGLPAATGLAAAQAARRAPPRNAGIMSGCGSTAGHTSGAVSPPSPRHSLT